MNKNIVSKIKDNKVATVVVGAAIGTVFLAGVAAVSVPMTLKNASTKISEKIADKIS